MRVSIVIDNYNYEAYVAQAIESALAQTHPDVEVIVVDDGSRDNSMDVICRYRERVDIIVDKPNGGQGSAYNAGYAQSHGELVMFLDADDWLYPDAVRDVVAAWRPGVSKVQFQLDMVDSQGTPVGRRVPRDMHEDARDLVRRYGTYGTPPGSGNVYHRSHLDRVLPMDPKPWRIGADTLPILLAPIHGEVISIERPLGAYRIHRPADDGSLLFNNSPSGLACEFERLVAAKTAVSKGMQLAGVETPRELGYAPWEARIVAICMRFGGPQTLALVPDSPRAQIGRALRSLWNWPEWPYSRRLAMMAWVLLVTVLPRPLAHRLAMMHRRSTGAPTAA